MRNHYRIMNLYFLQFLWFQDLWRSLLIYWTIPNPILYIASSTSSAGILLFIHLPGWRSPAAISAGDTSLALFTSTSPATGSHTPRPSMFLIYRRMQKTVHMRLQTYFLWPNHLLHQSRSFATTSQLRL